jgi:hypothetical protein
VRLVNHLSSERVTRSYVLKMKFSHSIIFIIISAQMLPEVNVFDAVYFARSSAFNGSCHVTTCRSPSRHRGAFSSNVQPPDSAAAAAELFDAFFVRRDAADELYRRRRPSDQPPLPVRHLTVVRHPPTTLRQLLAGLDFRQITSLCLVDCPIKPETLADDAFSGLSLRTLVMSGTGIRRLPIAVLRLSTSTLETLKIDRNRLGPELPADVIGNFVSLRTLICDAQRPRLRRLPRALVGRLSRLEVLSVADNRIPVEDLDHVATSAPNLRVFVCRRNRIARLPVGLDRLDRLAVVDASHNRIEELPTETVEPLVGRLSRCDLYNAALFRRPEYRSMRRCDSLGLAAHFLLSNALAPKSSIPETCDQQPSDERVPGASGPEVISAVQEVAHVRDITIAIVGESRAGKRTLIEALAVAANASTGNAAGEPRGVGVRSRQATSGTPSVGGTGGFLTLEFDVRQSDGGLCHVTALALSGDELADEYVRQVRVDLVLLTFDLQNTCNEQSSQQSNGTRYVA